MEKRAFTRQVLHHAAQYSSPHQKPLPCVIKDFCKTGLFITFENPELSAQHALTVNDTLFVDFKSSGILQLNYRLHVRIARIVEGALGLEITHNNPEAIHALYKLSKEPAATQPRNSDTRYQHLHSKCKQIVESFLTASHRELYRKIDKQLLERAEHATDNAHETSFADTASRFRKYQERIHQAFHKGVLQQVENWLEGIPVSLPEAMQPEKSAGLALVEKEEFEDWLLVKVIINKADQHYKETLYDLQLRMSEMSGAEISYKNNPLSPAYVSHAFYRAISPLQLSRDMMQAVLSAFQAQVVVEGLAQLYSTLNQLFIDNDVLPTIVYHAVKADSPEGQYSDTEAPGDSPEATQEPVSGRGSSSQPISGAANDAAVTSPAGDSAQNSMRTLSTVQSMLALRHRHKEPPEQHPGHPIQRVATEQLMSQLNLYQKQQAPASQEAGIRPLSERIAEWCGEEQQLSEQDNTAVEVTEKFFSAMDANQHLSTQIKPVFKQLEIPLLKIFIKDASFFEDANHPARQVLNRLARLGAHGGELSQQNSQRVENAIKTINQEFEDDPSIFNQAVNELDELITRQEKAAQRNTERLVKSCDGLETIEKGKYSIRRFIEEELSGKIVPRALVDLINQGWRELLVFTLLRDGQGSAIWNSYANVVKSLGQVDPQSDRSLLHQQGTGLLKIIEIGINEAPGGQSQMKKLLPALADLLTPNANSPAPEFTEADTLLAPPDDAFSYIDDEAIQNKALSRWVRRARNLQVGAWVEYGENDEATQMRLAWIGQDHHKFVFVNHQGMKVVELSLREMAEHLQSGHARRIDDPDQPFVDQNLDAMVQDMYNQMNYQATHDELTGLINRKEFERHLKHALADARGRQNQHAVCHMDLDQFKVINTACGHEAGDTMLKKVGDLLNTYIQEPNVVARSAGDEFLFILKNYDMPSAKNFALEIKEAVQELRFDWGDKTYTLGASIGLVSIDEASQSVQSILNCADSARLSAKESGRNKVYIYEPDDKDQAIRNEVMNNMARLNRALDEERLTLRCQKISPVADNDEKPHYEVLLSVEDELGIQLAPGDFIHAAERYNRMQAIDRWVIHNVFSWANRNRDKLDQIDCCTINLSGHSLNDETLMDHILDKLLEFEIPRDKVCFEVTETAAVKNLADAVEVISELKDLGFKFALDDFGTGLSSYTYLKKLPVDYLKIDGAFIKGIANNPEDLAMVRSINEMAHLMGKQTIAEYVENAAIEEQLVQIGIDYAQGYHIEKPIALDTLFSGRAVA